MDKISPIKERILKFIDLKGIKKVDFCEITGISYANLKGKSLYSEIGGDKIAEILSIYPELNPEWLLTGNGPMLKNGDEKKTERGNTENMELVNSLIDRVGDLRQKLGEQVKENEYLYQKNIELQSQINELQSKIDELTGVTGDRWNKSHYGDSVYSRPDIAAEPEE